MPPFAQLQQIPPSVYATPLSAAAIIRAWDPENPWRSGLKHSGTRLRGIHKSTASRSESLWRNPQISRLTPGQANTRKRRVGKALLGAESLDLCGENLLAEWIELIYPRLKERLDRSGCIQVRTSRNVDKSMPYQVLVFIQDLALNRRRRHEHQGD
jgi:hypothetical protein